jgi:hypothetical protein
LDIFTEKQFKSIYVNIKGEEEKFDENFKKLLNLNVIRKITMEDSGRKEDVYFLANNGAKYIEETNDAEIEYEEKTAEYFNDNIDKLLAKLVTNELVIKYFNECSLFHSFEINPRIEIEYNEEKGYIEPSAVINFGEDLNHVHFLVYTLRKFEGWKEESVQNLSYLEAMYLTFEENEIITKKPLLLCVCEDEKQMMELYKELEETEIPLDFVMFITDEDIYSKEAYKSITIIYKDEEEKVQTKNVEVNEMR